ncbi:hypothetical protein DAT299_14520 [Streptococcus suis]|nr:hypothetical protein DAT299_14520 [Streptococcus suis]
MGLFVYTQKGSIISTVDLPTTEIIEPKNIEIGHIVKRIKSTFLATRFYAFFGTLFLNYTK